MTEGRPVTAFLEKWRLATALLLSCWMPLCCVAATAGKADCAAVYAALGKLATTPNHQFMATRSDTHPGVGSDEVIVTRDAMYVQVKGQWHAHAYNGAESRRQIEQGARTAPDRCLHVRDESVDGVAASLYQTQNADGDGSSVDTQLWISSATGLPLRQRIDVDVGGKQGKSSTEVRFDYSDVVAPAGAK